MENKFFEKGCVTIDGRLDDPIWESVEAQGSFTMTRYHGNGENKPSPQETYFKMIRCEDRIYIGVYCEECDMEYVRSTCNLYGTWITDSLEFWFAPSGNDFATYQFAVTFSGVTATNFYSERGTIQPDRYAPDWKSAVYHGENFWSAEVEIPLTAFYMTPNDIWTDKWLMNVGRARSYRCDGYQRHFLSWSKLQIGFNEAHNYNTVGGFPMRPVSDDIRIVSAITEIEKEDEKGFHGSMIVKTLNAVDGEFEFVSDFSEPATVSLKAGANEFKVPCCVPECGRPKTGLCLKRICDGKEFKRYYPMRVTFEPIQLKFTLPEFRTNFYPGQDYSKIVGTAIAAKPVTLHLEGPGIEPQTIHPDAEGNFVFETPNFEVGEAKLTVSNEDKTIVKTMRRLAPTGHTMTWISGGNLIIDGEPTFSRHYYATYYAGGEAFKKHFDNTEMYITKKTDDQEGMLQPDGFLRDIGDKSNAETHEDIVPSQLAFDYVDQLIENNKDRDFTHYYLSDEPECRNVSPIYLQHLYEYIREKDPYHVIHVVSTACDTLLNCADWFATHPYIDPYDREDGVRIHHRPFNTMGKYVDDIALLNRPDKCVGFLPTCFGGLKFHKNPYPTFEEYVGHTWAGIMHGAKTLEPYAYHDLNDRASIYEGSRYIFSSIIALEDILLFAKRTTLLRTQEVDCVLYEHGDEQMFVLVNMTKDPQKVTIDGLKGEWYNFRHEGMITGNSFDLKPMEVVIGTSKVRDEGLATYEEIEKLINEKEHERVSRGNLLFERHDDIECTGTVPVDCRKLVDGVPTNFGWLCAEKGEKFAELDLTKVAPKFTKVAVHGYNIADMDIKLRFNGELVAPEVTEKQTEEYTTTFLLKDAVAPDALRLEFHAEEFVELYEIEVFA